MTTLLVGNYHRAGRSQHEMGPYFKPSKQMSNLYSEDRSKTFVARLFPRIDRGFFISDNDWTCYRRNYFQISASFTCFDAQGVKLELPCLVEVEGRGLRTVTEFQIHTTAKTGNGSRDVDLVQHTAKRDKVAMPAPKLCFPSELTPSFSIRQEGDAHTTVTWERMQFKSATQNNGKRRAAQQYHVLYIELLALCDDGYLARVATAESAPLVVRGRAPGHYAAMANKEAQEQAENSGLMQPNFPYGYQPGMGMPGMGMPGMGMPGMGMPAMGMPGMPQPPIGMPMPPQQGIAGAQPTIPAQNDPASQAYYQQMMQGYYAYHPYYAAQGMYPGAAQGMYPGQETKEDEENGEDHIQHHGQDHVEQEQLITADPSAEHSIEPSLENQDIQENGEAHEHLQEAEGEQEVEAEHEEEAVEALKRKADDEEESPKKKRGRPSKKV